MNQVTIKKHPRARCAKLKASLKHGVELIVPPRFNQKYIPEILEENRAWIEKHLLILAKQHAANNDALLPEKISLRAMDQTWTVEYIKNDLPLQMIFRPHQAMVMIGNIEDKTACKKLLIRWLKKMAKNYFSTRLKTLCEKTGLTCHKITIRDQCTRWGSCSLDKHINLNYKILFLPDPLANYILIHELCHTVHLNHSDRFWKLVARWDPDWQTHRARVRKVNEFVPDWTSLN